MNTEITIGRAENCDIRLDERCLHASNKHAVISYDGSRLMYKDISTNGTFINNVKVHRRTVVLHRGDVIMIAGKYLLKWNHIDACLCRMGSQSSAPAIPPSYASNPVVASGLNNGDATPMPPVNSVSPMAPSSPAVQYQGSQVAQHPINSVDPSNANLSGFSWGAFVLSGIWGLFNGCWWMILINIGIALLMFVTAVIPFIPLLFAITSLILSIWFGVKGREWAWKNRQWSSAESFNQAQKTWNIVGIVFIVLALLLPIILLSTGVSILSSII